MADEKKVLDRITKLMALARSPVEEEARTAAMCAVSMILEHGVELRFPETARLRKDFQSWTSTNTGRGSPHQNQTGTWVDEWGQEYQYYEAPPPPPPKSRHKRARESRIDEPVLIQSRYTGCCKHCGDVIKEGDEAFWMRGRGITHVSDTCRQFWDS